MVGTFLKVLGMGDRGTALPKAWKSWDRGKLAKTMIFPKGHGWPTVRKGDKIVYYAAGPESEGYGRVFAIATATSDPYEVSGSPWPYHVDVEMDIERDLVSEGILLRSIKADRELTKSIRQQRHIHLRVDEYAEIVRVLSRRATTDT